jgi:hypothetical protein
MAAREPPDIRALAQRYTHAALKTLAAIMEHGASEAARIAAADKILDRAHGKPKAESEAAGGQTLRELLDDDDPS